MINEALHPEHSNTAPPGPLPVGVAPLRVLLAIGSLLLLAPLASQFLMGQLRGLADLWIGSIVPALSAMMAMVLMFDVLMMLMLRRARPPAQRRIDKAFIVAWLALCAMFSALLALQITLRLP